MAKLRNGNVNCKINQGLCENQSKEILDRLRSFQHEWRSEYVHFDGQSSRLR